MSNPLAALCLEHLEREEAMLTTALAMVSAIQSAFGVPAQNGVEAFTAALGRHREFAGVVGDIQRRRRQFADAAAGHMGVPSKDITLSAVLARLPNSGQGKVADTAGRVRGLAHQLAAANFVVAVHVRVHLDAHRRILRDLTNTKDSSGRYCRAGHAETLEYRSMLQIHG